MTEEELDSAIARVRMYLIEGKSIVEIYPLEMHPWEAYRADQAAICLHVIEERESQL